MSKKLWGGRFKSDAHSELEKFTASIDVDCELAREDILGSLAHAKMLSECKIITSFEYEQIKEGLLAIDKKISSGKIQFDIAYEDIHMNIEHLLTQEIGEPAKKLHTARSRNDQVALDVHLYLREQILAILNLMQDLQSVLLNRVKNDRSIVLPGYTHLQRAQPISLAKHWLANAAMIQRDMDRLKECWRRVNLCPLGACALAGTNLPINRESVARELAFDGIYINTLDAVSDRDFVIEFLSIASLFMMHMSRLSEELVLWSSQEFSFIEFADAFATGSSIMPQKKNPDVAELTRGRTGRVYGALFNLLTIMKGLPLAYNRDMQEDKEPLFDTVKTVRGVLTIYKELLSSIKINTANMFAATQTGFLNATALADYLVKKDVPFREAHEIVGKMVVYCLDKQCTLESLSHAESQQFSSKFDQDMNKVLNVKTLVMNQDLLYEGLSLIDQEVAAYEKKSATLQIWLEEKIEELSDVKQKFGITSIIPHII